MTKRSMVYVDGFNLYYGALKGTPHKWLNLQRYFELLRQDDDLGKIWYFTAEVDGPAHQRQATYLDALRTLPRLEVVLGKYKRKAMRCSLPCDYPKQKKSYTVPEEKQTDVNIALQMLDDAYQGVCDRMVLVSGDSDLVPAIKRVKQRHPKLKIVVYVPAAHPQRGAATELRRAADQHATLPRALLAKTQFPPSLLGASGQSIAKPSSW